MVLFVVPCSWEISVDWKMDVFLGVLRESSYLVIKKLSLSRMPRSQKYEDIKRPVLRHSQPINYEVVERAQFHQLRRKEFHNICAFVLQLQTEEARFKFGDQMGTQIRGHLFAWINNKQQQQKLLLLPDPALQRVREVCEQYQNVINLIESTSKILLISHVSVHQKWHSNTLREFKP